MYNTCKLPFIIKDHWHTMIHLMTLKLSTYNMAFNTTKCLNTAVTIMFLFFGNDGLRHTRYCDVSAVDKRYNLLKPEAKKQYKQNYVKSLRKHLFNKSDKNRTLFYVMLTDCDMTRNDEQQYFPGHVFVIEKVPSDVGNEYYIYQSYINKYPLTTTKMDDSFLSSLLDDMEHFVMNDTWCERCAQFYERLSFVNVDQYLGYRKDHINICIRNTKVKTCSKTLKSFLETSKIELSKGAQVSSSAILLDIDLMLLKINDLQD